MPLKITYWTASRINPNMAGAAIAPSEVLTISGTTALSAGATPANACFVTILATETAAFDYSSAASSASAALSAQLVAGERIWLDAVPAYKVAGIQAT